MLARSVVLESESRERFEKLHASLLEELQPATAIEKLLVMKMVTAQWRQMRQWNYEREGQQSDRSTTTETRYDRQFERSLNTLLRLRDQKSAPNPQPVANTCPPAQL